MSGWGAAVGIQRPMIDHQATPATRWALAAAFVIAVVAVLAAVAHANYLLFHSLVEAFSSVVAFGIFAIAWNSRRFSDAPFFLFIGVSYLVVGGLDMLHAFSYKGIGVFPDVGADLSTRLWIVTRYLEAISCLIAVLLAKRGWMPHWLPSAYAAAAVALIGLLFLFDLVPVCYAEGVGQTPFKIASEYAVIVLKGVTAVVVFGNRALHERVRGLLLGYLGVSAAAELAFAQYVGVYDVANEFGHILKVLAFTLIYKATIRTALVEPYNLLFRNLQSAKDGLESIIGERTRELAKSNEALASANAYLDAMINASPLAIIALDREARVTMWNAAAEKCFGWRAEEIVGKPLPAAPEPWLAQQRELITTVLSGHRIDGLEMQGRRKDDGAVDLRVYCAPLLGEHATPTGMMSVCLDIGHEKRARQILHEREEYLRSIMENVADAIVTIDQGGLVESFNPAAEQLFGYRAAEVVGRNVAMLMPGPEASQHDGYLKRYLDTGVARMLGNAPREVTALHKDGTQTTIELQISEMLSGRRRIFVGVARDVTARRQAAAEKAALERELMQAHKMEALGNLAGGIAHEVNNMLVPIVGLTDLSLKRAPPELRGNLERVLSAAERARQIVSRVLTFSRTAQPQPKPVRLAEVLSEAVRLLAVGLPPAIDVRYAIKDENLVVMSDATEIHQIIMNLVNNAAHAIGERGGMIDIELDSQEATLPNSLHPGHFAVLRISDSGSGMDERTLSKIFEPFFTTKGVGMGSGMGLSVVHGIVAKWGGTITVESRRGEGSSFTVRLPLHHTTGAPPADAVPA